jgi:CheY-like chemotaxis protein
MRIARLPERFVAAGVRGPREDEEEIGESVQVDEHQRVQLHLTGSLEDVALGPPADGSRDVQRRGQPTPARQDEALELGQTGVEPVAIRFQRVHLSLADTEPVGDTERDADVGTDVEELVLDPPENGSHLFRELAREREAQQGVDLVDRPERGDSAVELGYAAPVSEARLSAVAPARVDARQTNRFVCLARHGSSLRSAQAGRCRVYTCCRLANSESSTILVAEDDDALRSLLTATLRREGYQVLEAADGIRLVRLVAEQEVDALLLEVVLGVDDGVALGHELRRERPNLPIALLSGDRSVTEMRECAAGLTDLFLEKPFTLPEITATVEDLLGRAR